MTFDGDKKPAAKKGLEEILDGDLKDFNYKDMEGLEIEDDNDVDMEA